MPSGVSALFEPLIARDLEAIPAVAAEFLRDHDSSELYLAVARFAVLSYAPSQHAKHAVLAALAAHDLREEAGERWNDLLLECARYASASRQPWSEPPMMTPPSIDRAQRADRDELRAAIGGRDRLRAERWLAARIDDPALERDLLEIAAEDASDMGHKLIITDAALRLIPILGDKGRYVALRMAVWELVSYGGEEPPPTEDDLNRLIARCVAEDGSLESAHAVFHFAAKSGAPMPPFAPSEGRAIPIYRLARDLGAALQAHAVAKRLRSSFPDADLDAFVAAVERNLETAPSLEEWSFA